MSQAVPTVHVLEMIPFAGGHLQVLESPSRDLAFSIPDLCLALGVKSGTARMALTANLSSGEYFKARTCLRRKIMGCVTSSALIKILRSRIGHSRSWIRESAKELLAAVAPLYSARLACNIMQRML